jgi:hypothetical protein
LLGFNFFRPLLLPSVHDGVEEDILTEHDDTSQAEVSQPYYRAVQSITTDNENKDIETKGNKKVKCIETEKSENKQAKAGKKNYRQFHEDFKQHFFSFSLF